MENSEKKSKNFSSNDTSPIANLTDLTDGLIYISETDADIIPFDLGEASGPSAEILAKAAGIDPTLSIEKPDTYQFFQRLMTPRDGYSAERLRACQRYEALYKALKDEVRDLTVFKFGDIRVEIFIAGIDRNGHLIGVRTRAVET